MPRGPRLPFRGPALSKVKEMCRHKCFDRHSYIIVCITKRVKKCFGLLPGLSRTVRAPQSFNPALMAIKLDLKRIFTLSDTRDLFAVANLLTSCLNQTWCDVMTSQQYQDHDQDRKKTVSWLSRGSPYRKHSAPRHSLLGVRPYVVWFCHRAYENISNINVVWSARKY